jgi:hypothetical protein
MEGDPVPFNVLLIDIAGNLSGQIDEPNTFCPSGLNSLAAQLSGQRTGECVNFVKMYENTSEFTGHDVHYSGALNEEETEIIGTWDIKLPHPGWSGTFIMNRESGQAERSADKISEKELLPLELVGAPKK